MGQQYTITDRISEYRYHIDTLSVSKPQIIYSQNPEYPRGAAPLHTRLHSNVLYLF